MDPHLANALQQAWQTFGTLMAQGPASFEMGLTGGARGHAQGSGQRLTTADKKRLKRARRAQRKLEEQQQQALINGAKDSSGAKRTHETSQQSAAHVHAQWPASMEQGPQKRQKKVTYAVDFEDLEAAGMLLGVSLEYVARCLQESVLEEGADVQVLVPRERITSKLQHAIPGRIIPMPDDREEFRRHGALLCEQLSLTPYKADAARLSEICQTYQVIVPFNSFRLSDSPPARNGVPQEQPMNLPSVPVASTQHPLDLATQSLSFAPPQSPPVPFKRSVTLPSVQEMSRTALESLDQNALRAGDVQAGEKVSNDRSSGKEEVAKRRVTFQVDRKAGAEGAAGEDGERGAGRSNEKLHKRVHDVSQTSAGGKLMESAAKPSSEENTAPPGTGGTDAFSLSDEEDERPAKAGARWLGLLHDSHPWKTDIDLTSKQGSSQPPTPAADVGPRCDTPPKTCRSASARGPATHKKPPLAPEREGYWEATAPDRWFAAPKHPGGVLRTDLQKKHSKK